MNARRIRANVRLRAQAHRAAARIRRRGNGSLASHAIAAGLAPTQARTVAKSLRTNAASLGLTGALGRAHAGRQMRDCRRYTPAEVAQIALVYRPRKHAYKAARAYLLAS